MDYQKTLQNMGLAKPEADVYLAALQLGKALPSVLARKANIKRPTLYKLLPKLIDLGLISETIIGRRRYLIGEDPQTYLEAKQNELKSFENILPELHLLLSTALVKPKIIFYEGIKGIQRLYMETLKEGVPIFEFVSLDNISKEIEFHSKNYYIPQRINRKIPIKILVSGKTQSDLINLKTSQYESREVKVIDANEDRFPIPLDCYIFGDNVALALYRKDSEPIGIIIRSIEISTMMRSLFNFTWEKCA